ncbi:MAG: stage II sporulation protein M [Bacteroidota bacterium]
MLKENFWKTLISIFFFTCGCLFVLNTYQELNDSSNLGSVNGLIDFAKKYSRHDFLQVLSSNIIVLIVILYAGFFTGGLMSALVLFWNGLIAMLVFVQFADMYAFDKLLYAFMLHGSIELPVFFIAANKSYRGLNFYLSMYREKLNLNLIPSPKEFAGLGAALVLAALVETNL